MSFKLLTEQHLEFLSLKGACTVSSESTLVKMPHCWKSYAVAHLFTDGDLGDSSEEEMTHTLATDDLDLQTKR